METQQPALMSFNSRVVTACAHAVTVTQMSKPSKEMLQQKPR